MATPKNQGDSSAQNTEPTAIAVPSAEDVAYLMLMGACQSSCEQEGLSPEETRKKMQNMHILLHMMRNRNPKK